jgi:peptide/nickel transport system substrate-binding protein
MKSLPHLCLICAILLICSCDSEKKASKRSTAEYNPIKIVNGGTLVVGIRAEPESLNPLLALSQTSRNIISLVFRRLADINEDLRTFTPVLAKNWIFSPDSLSITFNLKTDVLWHDGMPFSAADIVFTYKMQTDPAIGWDGISFKETIRSVDAPNDSTVVFLFYRKSPAMLMDAVEGYILPEHILASVSPEDMHKAEFNRRPVGTGPFKFQGWKDQQTITLVRNNSYYETGKPHLDRIIFKVVPDNINLLSQLKSGEVDLVESLYPRDFQALSAKWEQGQANIRPVSYLGRRYDFIGWNLIDPDHYRQKLKQEDNSLPIEDYILPNRFFGSQKVRSALTMALDREALTNAVNYGMAIPMHGPVPLILNAYNEAANVHWSYDPQQALRILSEEGWSDTDKDGILDKDGIPFEFELITESGNTRWEQAATIIQDQLAKIGVHVSPRLVEPALLYGKLLPLKEFDAVLIGWVVGLTMDYAPLFHSSSFFTPFHFTGYYSSKYDSLDDASKKSFNPAVIQKYYDEIAGLLSHDLPYTWLYYRQECSAIHVRFKNVTIDKRGMFINPEDWWVPVKERSRIDKLFEG